MKIKLIKGCFVPQILYPVGQESVRVWDASIIEVKQLFSDCILNKPGGESLIIEDK